MIDNIKTYKVIFPKSAYTIPVDARAQKLTFDATYMHIHLQDERIVSVPLSWIPSLAQATPADREKYQIGWDGRLLYWDPDDGPINEDLLVSTYLVAGNEPGQAA